MKFSIIIAEKKVITQSDTKTWIDISKNLNQNNTDATPILKNTINLIKSKFPEIPNKMVWGNYLIFEEYENIVAIDIDFDNIELIKTEILLIALSNDLAVLIGKENKIYREISEIKQSK